MSKQVSPAKALRRFGLKQSLKGALIIGILAGIMIGGQGAAYAATYPDETSRTQFKLSLEKAPALGILYGETANLPSPAGYMVYRTVAFLTFVASIWGLMTIIRLLRGQEEDGRWELIASGSTTSRGASYQVLLGFGMSLFIAFAICVVGTTLLGLLPSVDAPATAGLFIGLAIFLPVALFGGVGFLVSQLATTKRRALFYGLIPLLLLFALRAIGNTAADLRWLKNFTPFGWTDLASPVVNPQMVWLLPAVILAPVLIGLGMYLIDRRDLGAGIIHESAATKPRYFLLGSAMQLAIRQNIVLFVSWGLAALAMSALIAQISSIAAEAVSDSESLKNAIGQLGESGNLAIAFIGAGLVFTVMVLLIMTTVCIANIRATEAKNQLDNILVQPVQRSRWLAGRLVVITVAFTLISVICALATWVMASAQNISLDLGNLLLISLALTGTVIFTLGLGTLLYGILPRLAVAGMYVVIGWSFLIDMIGSVVKLDNIFINSSLFHYVSISPTKAPDWATFAWLATIGIAMAAVGVVAFTRRDIIAQ